MNFILQLFQLHFDLEHLSVQLFESKTLLFFLSSGIIVILFLWVMSLVGNPYVSFLILLVATILTGFANQQKQLYRGEPLYPSDLAMVRNLPFLIDMVNPLLVFLLIFLVAISITICIFIYKKTYKKFTMKSLIFRTILFVFTSSILFYTGQFNQQNNYVRELFNINAYWITFSQQLNYEGNGFIPGFLYNLNAPAVDRPARYSKEKVEQIVNEYSQKAIELNKDRVTPLTDVNILFVMNESFSDPYEIEGMKISEDPIPNIRKIMKNNLSGKILSQGYGGGTANIEFEALTGISIEPLASNITTPYIQLTSKMSEFPTIVSYLKQHDYTATAIHPFNTTMYKRNDVYKEIGFDHFISESTMKNDKILESNRYISDESAYKEILDRMNNTPTMDFIHLVTMQNHMDYTGKYPDTEFQAVGSSNDEEAINYYQDLQYSDIALKEFLNDLDSFEEKTMVVFWGDHLPSFYGKKLYDENGLRTMHETPLIIYTNYNKEEKYINTISPIYLLNHVLEKNNAPLTPFQTLLLELESVLPAFEKNIYIENVAEEIKASRSDLAASTLKVLNDYDMVLYDLTTGENHAHELGFYEIKD